MGTSVSVRSPANGRRWIVVRASIQNGAPVHEALAAIMVAASSDAWRSMLESPGIQVYAERAAAAWEEMPARLERQPVREAVNGVVEQARTDALAAGGGLAVALAERALARTLLERFSDREPDGAVPALSGWRESRGLSPGDLAGAFLVETMRQLASHLFARDASAFTGTAAIPDARALRELTRAVGDAAAETTQPARAILHRQGAAGWIEGVRLAFQTGAGRRPSAGGPV